MLRGVRVCDKFYPKVLCFNLNFFNLALRYKWALYTQAKVWSLGCFKLHLSGSSPSVSFLDLGYKVFLGEVRSFNHYGRYGTYNSFLKVDLAWMRALFNNDQYTLWSLFFRFRASQQNFAAKLSGREFHTLSKIYGKSVRKHRFISRQAIFFWGMRSDLGAMGLSKLNCKEIYTYTAPLKSMYRSGLRLIQTYDIGFFFPNSTLTSKPLRQSTKDFSYKPSHMIKSNSPSLFTPMLSLFKARRRFLERINPAFTSYTHAICGGAQKSARAYAKVPAGLSKGGKAPVKPNLVFRLLASHRSNAMRPLKRKFRTALGVQTFNLKKLTQFKVNLKKKHHWFLGSLGLRSKHVNLPTSPLTYQMGSNRYLYKNKNHTSVNSFGVSLDLKSREALMPSLARDDVFFKQPLVRYKPGLMRHWRVHRFFFQKHFSLGSKLRQKRLTRYVSKLANVTSFSFYKAIELSVLHVIRASQFILGLSLGQLQVLLDKVCVYINGIQVYNPYSQVYLGDVLFINMFSISIANFQNNAYLNDVKLKSAVSKLQLHLNFFGLKFTSDNPSYFEIDELTSTLVLLNEPEVGFYESNPLMYRFPHVTFRMYNWKYVV